MRPAADLERAVPVAAGVHWIGAFDADLRSFDIILRTANGTSYNACAPRWPLTRCEAPLPTPQALAPAQAASTSAGSLARPR